MNVIIDIPGVCKGSTLTREVAPHRQMGAEMTRKVGLMVEVARWRILFVRLERGAWGGVREPRRVSHLKRVH